MSRQNKVNPGKYTQAGRLSQDDAAREMVKQRASIASQNHQQHERANEGPWAAINTGAAHEEAAEPEEEATPVAKKPARPAVKAKVATKKAAAPARKARTMKSAAKSTTAKSRRPVRKAALARSVVKKPAAAAKAKKTAKRTSTAKRAARR